MFILDRVRHGHGSHKAGYRLVVDRESLPGLIGGHDVACEVVFAVGDAQPFRKVKGSA